MTTDVIPDMPPASAVNAVDAASAAISNLMAAMPTKSFAPPPDQDPEDPTSTPPKPPVTPAPDATPATAAAPDLNPQVVEGQPDTEEVFLDDLVVGDYQLRAKGNDEKNIKRLAGFLKDGSPFPPAVVYRLPDGRMVLSHGHHRFEASKRVGRDTLTALVFEGDEEDAFMDAIRADNQDVLPRTNKDIANKIIRLLTHPTLGPTWVQRFNREIGREVGATAPTVQKYRRQLEEAGSIPVVKERQSKSGAGKMNTAAIGSTKSKIDVKSKAPAVASAEELADRMGAYFLEQDADVTDAKIALGLIIEAADGSDTILQGMNVGRDEPNFLDSIDLYADRLSPTVIGGEPSSSTKTLLDALFANTDGADPAKDPYLIEGDVFALIVPTSAKIALVKCLMTSNDEDVRALADQITEA